MVERIFGVACAAVLITAQALNAQQSCESLGSLSLPHATITSAALVPEGPVGGGGPGGPGGAAAAPVAPARCVVQGISRPTRDSEIRFEVWLPASGWNGKYLQIGNGGWAGSINARGLIDPVRRGYAAAGTDDGHQGGFGAAWAVGHPEKVIDFGYRAVHETSEAARLIVKALYGREPERAYFVGCSDGGREALMEAQRYPEDFVGIIAGAPASFWSHLQVAGAWDTRALTAAPIAAAKLPAIQRAALTACDQLDGVKDGLIEDPRACRFDPAVLTCKGAESPDCLSKPQVAALRKIYQGAHNPRTGASISPGYAPGTEAVAGGWSPWIIGQTPAGSLQAMLSKPYFEQVVFERPGWDFAQLDFDRDVAYADQKSGVVLDATNPDLRSFRASGGKLIQYHGWGDAAITPFSSIEYYDSVLSFMGRYPNPRVTQAGPVQDFYRLFMVPGMGHCGGGVGPNSFGNGASPANADAEHDLLKALEQWVEKGVAPEKLIGTGRVSGEPGKTLTRPLCPYPQTAHYNGSGDVNDAASFTCAASDRGR